MSVCMGCSIKELMFQKELTLITQVHQKNVWSVIIGILKKFWFKFEPSVRNKRHDVLMTPNELKNIAILNVGGVDYRCVRR